MDGIQLAFRFAFALRWLDNVQHTAHRTQMGLEITVPRAGTAALAASARRLSIPEDESLVARRAQVEIRDTLRYGATAAFDDIEAAITGAIASPPYAALVRGLPADHGSAILIGFSAGLGELIEPYRQPWSCVVRPIIPSKDRAMDGRVLNEFIHTDGTAWPVPNDFTCLFCIEPDQHGAGQTRLLDVDSVVEDFEIREPGLAGRLTEQPAPWRIADELGAGVHWTPVLSPARDRIRWLRITIALAIQDYAVALAADTSADLDRTEELLESNPAACKFPLQRGDLLIIDNRRCLHARTPIPCAAESRRHLLRASVRS